MTVQWDGGTGTEMNIAPGATAMASGYRALELLAHEMKKIVYNSQIEYFFTVFNGCQQPIAPDWVTV